MPSDAARKRYTRHNCGGEIYWVNAQPYRSQQDADQATDCDTDDDDWEDDDDVVVHDSQIDNSQAVHLGNCMFACALLVAADGRLTDNEARLVIDGLNWSGLDSTELMQRFIEVCKKVHQEGAPKWIGLVSTRLAEDSVAADSGMSKGDLRELLVRLVEAEPADSKRKQELLRALDAGFYSSRSAKKPIKGVRNPFTGEIT